MKTRIDKIIIYLYLLIVGLWTIIPIFQVDLIFRLIILFLTIITIIISNGLKDIKGIICFVLLFILIINDLYIGNTDAVFFNFSLYFLLTLYLIFVGISKKNNFYKYENIYYISVVFSVIFNINTLIALWNTPYFVRDMVLFHEESAYLLKKGIGGFGLIFSQTLMILCSLFIYNFTNKSKFIKLLLIIHIITVLLLIYKANFLIALIALFFSLTTYLFLFHKNLTIIVVVFLVIIITFFSQINYQDFLQNLYDNSTGTAYQEKIGSLIKLSQGNTLTGDTKGRIERYQKSLQSFFKSPIIGSLFTKTANIGGHSFILDSLSKYGFLSFIIFYIIASLFILHYNQKNKIIKKLSFVIIVSVISSCLLNPMPYHYWFALFIYIPITFSIINKELKD